MVHACTAGDGIPKGVSAFNGSVQTHNEQVFAAHEVYLQPWRAEQHDLQIVFE